MTMQAHIERSANVAREAFAMLVRAGREGRYPELYCWATQRLEALHVAADKPHEDSFIAFPERIPGHLTQEQLIAWFAARTASVPYLRP